MNLRIIKPDDFLKLTYIKSNGIRFAKIERTATTKPQEAVKGLWKEFNPENTVWFSATAYHFAQTLYQSMNIPIGVIVSSWGGTRLEGWTNREILETYPDIDLDESVLITSSWAIYPINMNCPTVPFRTDDFEIK